jgi:hypothetical protein
MGFTIAPAYAWADGDLVTATRLASTASPTLADGQTYTFGAGSAAAPSVNFTGATTTGFYYGGGSLGFAVGGVSVAAWSSSAFAITTELTVSYTGATHTALSSSNTISQLSLDNTAGNATDATQINFRRNTVSMWVVGNNLGNASGDSFAIRNGTTDYLNITTTNITIASGTALKLGNAYQAGAPSSTGYITIKDSTGTTYKIPASV